MYSVQHEDIYEWVTENSKYFDLSESISAEIRGSTNLKNGDWYI
jgi:hypothetical protein